MSYYSIEEFLNLNGTYPYRGHGPQHFSSANVEQGEHSTQNFPPASIDLLDWDKSFLIPSSSLSHASATLPMQTSLSGMPVLPSSCMNVFVNNSRTLSVAAPAPVPHVTRTKAALRTMMSFGDQEDDTRNNSAIDGEPLKITDAHARVNSNNHVLHSNVQTAMDYNTLVNSGNNKQTTTTTGRSKLVIRPISPSTLMALTEPCLMAWCTPFDESLAELGSLAYFPWQNSDYDNHVVDKNNAWGY